MNVKTLIEVLEKEVKPEDRENAELEFWIGSKQYDIMQMGGFSLSPDITIQLKPIQTAMIQPARFKAEHSEMVSKKMKEIQKKHKQ